MLLAEAASLRYLPCGRIAYAEYAYPYYNPHSGSYHARVIAEYVAKQLRHRDAPLIDIYHY